MAIDPGTTLILITCLICTIVLAFAGKETGDKLIWDNRQLVTRKSGISNLVEKKTQDMETRIIEVKVRLIGQRNQHELHWRFS